MAVKNLKHNFCVHPYGGRPREGVALVYWSGCDIERLKLDFFDLGETVVFGFMITFYGNAKALR